MGEIRVPERGLTPPAAPVYLNPVQMFTDTVVWVPGGVMANDELRPGQVFTSPSKTLTDAHFLFFSGLTGDNHPIHYDVEYARTTRFGKPLAHGLLLASLTALGASPASPHLDGFVFVEQGSRFLKPVAVGDTMQPRLTVERVWDEGRRRFVRLATSITNQRGETVLEGFHLYQIIPRRADTQHGEEGAGSGRQRA